MKKELISSPSITDSLFDQILWGLSCLSVTAGFYGVFSLGSESSETLLIPTLVSVVSLIFSVFLAYLAYKILKSENEGVSYIICSIVLSLSYNGLFFLGCKIYSSYGSVDSSYMSLFFATTILIFGLIFGSLAAKGLKLLLWISLKNPSSLDSLKQKFKAKNKSS